MHATPYTSLLLCPVRVFFSIRTPAGSKNMCIVATCDSSSFKNELVLALEDAELRRSNHVQRVGTHTHSAHIVFSHCKKNMDRFGSGSVSCVVIELQLLYICYDVLLDHEPDPSETVRVYLLVTLFHRSHALGNQDSNQYHAWTLKK